VVVGGDELVIAAGPCSVESEAQIMASARMAKEAGADVLRGGVHKYRSSPYSGWEGVGTSPEGLRRGLKWIVTAGREFELPVVVEIQGSGQIPIYEELGVDWITDW
jgi:3-deoxy-7-phosphoheptulonate synthase